MVYLNPVLCPDNAPKLVFFVLADFSKPTLHPKIKKPKENSIIQARSDRCAILKKSPPKRVVFSKIPFLIELLR
jgi:hypothetical protein